jgi:hypothetical protein
MTSEPPVLKVGEEPPPMHRMNGSTPTRHQGNGKAKGKPVRRSTGNRFALLNAFVDFTLTGLTRNEIAVWLLLYRDTKPDGTARTSQVDVARRAGTSERTIRRAIRRLENIGLLKVVHRGGFRRGLSRYRVRPQRTDGA